MILNYLIIYKKLIIATLFLFSTSIAAQNNINIVLDNSGSMSKFSQDIAKTIALISRENKDNFATGNLINLYTFTDKLNLEIKGDKKNISTAIEKMSYSGGTEDGVIAINEIILNSKDAVIILFTDEGRDVVDDIDLDNLINLANKNNVRVHSVIKTPILCNNQEIIGINRDLLTLNQNGSLVDCLSAKNNSELYEFIGLSNKAYVRIAHESGGMIWSLNSIYFAGDTAFIDRNGKIELVKTQPHLKLQNIEHFSFLITEEFSEKHLTLDVSTQGTLSSGEIITLSAIVRDKKSKELITPAISWDFDQDGEIDDFGPVVNLTFPNNNTLTMNVLINNEDKEDITYEKHTVKIYSKTD